MKQLTELLPSLPAVIAAVGSGGKTTCLKAIACSAYAEGRSTLLTTTTHMRRETAVTDLTSPHQAAELLKRVPVLFAGSPASPDKIGPLPQEIQDCLSSLAQLVLVEADGSRGLPMKYPAPWEPVLPKQTDHVLVLFGLSALGRPLRQVCHRWELAADRFGWTADVPVTPQMAAAVLEAGYFSDLRARDLPFTLILNQADAVPPTEISRLVSALSPVSWISLSLQDMPHDLAQGKA